MAPMMTSTTNASRRAFVRRAASVVAAVAAVALLGTQAVAAPAPLQAICDLHFTGTSTLHEFHGTAPTFTLPVQTADLAGHWKTEAAVEVHSMVTANSSRDSNMWAMFDDRHWPQIKANFPDIDAAAAGAAKRISFQLTIRDVTREVVATVTSWQQDADKVVFDADFDVSLMAFGLEAPSVLGLIHVGDAVAVGVHVVVTRTPAGA